MYSQDESENLKRYDFTGNNHQPLISIHALIHFHSQFSRATLTLFTSAANLTSRADSLSFSRATLNLSFHQPPISIHTQLRCHSHRLHLYGPSRPLTLLHSQSAIKTLISEKGQSHFPFLSLHRSVHAPLRSVLPSSRAARARNRAILVQQHFPIFRH